jgi:hypothetical protein
MSDLHPLATDDDRGDGFMVYDDGEGERLGAIFYWQTRREGDGDGFPMYGDSGEGTGDGEGLGGEGVLLRSVDDLSGRAINHLVRARQP